ncbi:hypothetical protein E2F50_19710 [Rhizobium deserti]|uniref:Uncharacterized protein n=1 Tax=Rhizobium deserti TaxID=2547961 RepID=A0A4R5UAP5_9HYPH|nr:hypothetical protein [Rhizobium deserti]TDK31886.1 hypothetical protein E2F50_19710 [Rhizobium deserti]
MSDFLEFAINKSPIRLTLDDIARWAGEFSHWDFYNSAALEIAKGYHRGELSYTFCDGVINDLWSGVQKGFGPDKNEMPEPFFEVYEAFDAGEYYRKPDKSDDPVAEFTDPAIAELATRFTL